MRREATLGFIVVSLAATGALFAGCASFEADICAYAKCDADGATADGPTPSEGGGPDAAPDVDAGPVLPPECADKPATNPAKCLTDELGVFVSGAKGLDTNPGTKEKPYKTIGQALKVRRRIFVCEGTYPESIDISGPVEVYGGVSCDFAAAGAKPRIVASKAAYAVKVANVSSAEVLLADLDVVGKAGTEPGESSVGMFVSESGNVRILRSRIEAQDGAEAGAKRDGAFAGLGTQAPKGGQADGNTGGVAVSVGACAGGGTSTGGKGGNIGFQGDDGSPKPPGGAKGDVGNCAAGGGTGKDGDPGNEGKHGAGANTVATVSSRGLAGTVGENGGSGTPGGAGGGGYGTAGAGGGGGPGGCGGQGGFGGGPGGSSVAIVAFSSVLKLDTVELVAKFAKAGGAGGAGREGQAGGGGGDRSGSACNGGNGAQGGRGGNGGGGAGGISAGIVWSGGKEPDRTNTQIARATTTVPAGGDPGGTGATAGAPGRHGDVLEIK